MRSAQSLPPLRNEPVLQYGPGSPERAALIRELERQSTGRAEVIPTRLGGEARRGPETYAVVMPHAHRRAVAKAARSTAEDVHLAIDEALKAKQSWMERSLAERSAVFLRAAELLAGPHRAAINASTMLGQSKTVAQAEIDAACESIDFLRCNVAFAAQIESIQPASANGIWNATDYRPLDGFVFAIAPFNFTAIALNLCTAPALMGNVVLLKPSETATHSNALLLEILLEAGLPKGVIQMLPGDGPTIGQAALSSPELGGIHFTGSTGTFERLWQEVGTRIGSYRQYPRLVGETGGKDFIVVHPSAAPLIEAVAVAMVRGAFEYQGQKCSAPSRMYVPQSLWPVLKRRLLELIAEIKVGDVTDFSNFMGAVIDRRSFDRLSRAISEAESRGNTRLTAGIPEDSVGYFVPPTLFEVQNPKDELLSTEYFGPMAAVRVYDDRAFTEVLTEIDGTSPYALTGAIFAIDRDAVTTALSRLRFAAGNFYINDKPTGAVVGQQPFGGGRKSGTNDKAGALSNLLRWTSPRTIKETFVPPTDYRYPSMAVDGPASGVHHVAQR